MNETTISINRNLLEELYLDARLLGQDTDQFVGLVHKKYFVRDLHRRAYECSRYKVQVAVGLIRIKNLGSSFSDKAALATELDRIGTLLDENLRLTDLATWYGANEFAFQMPHVNIDEATKACERIIKFLSEGLSFEGDFEFQVEQLDDSHTADMLTKGLKDSDFRGDLSDRLQLFQTRN